MTIFKNLSPDTAVLLLLSKVTQKLSTVVPSIKSPLVPCRGHNVRWTSALHRPKRIKDLFTQASSPAHIPNLHNKVSPPDTILLLDSSPFWSVPIHHLPTLPGLLHSEILYQSIRLMIIIHIFHYCCYILIFPAPSFSAPFQFVNGIQKILKVDFLNFSLKFRLHHLQLSLLKRYFQLFRYFHKSVFIFLHRIFHLFP